MIKPLKIADLTFSTNLIQGPLAGVSNAPFRSLIWQYSQPAFTYSEMISCKTLLYQSKAHRRLISIDAQEGPVCFQLSATEPSELGQAVRMMTDHGASLIDLNCGCPVPKIRHKGAGSRLLQSPQKLYQLIRAMKENTHLPVSIKIRVDGHSSDQNNRVIANVVNDAGTDFLTVHGRHWTDTYETTCFYDQIQFFVENVSAPVIGNGDIACIDSLKKMLQTGCAGAMIARAGVGQPWLINQLLADINEHPFIHPNAYEIGTLYIKHVTELVKLLQNEKFAILQARKLAKYYARTLPDKSKFCERMHQCETFSQFEALCRQWFR